MDRDALRTEIVSRMNRGARAPWSDAEFGRLAIGIFRYQAATNPAYGAFARSRGVDPESIVNWREIPAVPTRAFKDFPDGVHGPGPFEAVFRTSGTTTTGRRGEHRVRDLELYRHSLLATAQAFLRPEGIGERLRVLALVPSPAELPDSSLAHMAGALRREWDDGAGGAFAGSDWSLRLDEWEEALRRATTDGVPVLVIGTAFSLLSWMESRADRPPHRLPAGSRIMETGGYKGRRRAVPKWDLYESLSRTTGVPSERVVAEYGMTEMLSQMYDSSLTEALERPANPPERPGARPTSAGSSDPAERALASPPWVRTRVLDPATLRPVAPGEPGLLCHHDLANLDSVAAILTEDEGVEVEGGLRLLGRIRGAEPRGCSLSMEDLLAASATPSATPSATSSAASSAASTGAEPR